jgi:hypothetical protein
MPTAVYIRADMQTVLNSGNRAQFFLVALQEKHSSGLCACGS